MLAGLQYRKTILSSVHIAASTAEAKQTFAPIAEAEWLQRGDLNESGRNNVDTVCNERNDWRVFFRTLFED